MIAEAKAPIIRKDILLRQLVGSDDFTISDNRSFHLHLNKLNIPHEFREFPGVQHDVRGIFSALGDANWRYYRAAFAGLPTADVAPGSKNSK
jgi:acetyl esterase/lipase